MARTDLEPTVALGAHPALPIEADAADVAFVDSDDTDGNAVVVTGHQLVLVHNTDVAAAVVTFTVHGVAHDYSVGAGEVAAFGPFAPRGWHNSDGKLHIDTEAATLKLAVIELPA